MSKKPNPATAVPAALELATVNPADLHVRDQAREDATPDDALIQSVKAMGIIQPPVVEPADTGGYVIVTGHRRVGAAIAAGLTEITVIVRPAGNAEALTLEQQIVENERRKGLTAADLARGYANLETMFGQTPEDIAAALAESPEKIRAGIRAARSKKTTELLAERPDIDLAQAAVIAEFDDHPKYQKELTETATDRPQNFGYKVESIRASLALDDARSKVVAELDSAGVRVIKVDQYGHPSGKTMRLSMLADENGNILDVDTHATCPGHGAYPGGWSAEQIEPVYACENWEQHGHQSKHSVRTAEQEAAAAARRERDELVKANRAARREWIADLLPGKINQLAGVYDYMAAALLRETHYYGDHRQPELTLALLRRDTDNNPTDTYADVATQTAPFRMMLATALAVHEAELADGRAAPAVRHFDQLQRWGYQLSDIDTESYEASQRILTAATAEQDALAEDPDVEEDEDAA